MISFIIYLILFYFLILLSNLYYIIDIDFDTIRSSKSPLSYVYLEDDFSIFKDNLTEEEKNSEVSY